MEENKLIAEFMGVDQVDIDTWLETSPNLKYHTSWDWLMPVISKCLEIGANVPIERIYHSLHTQDMSFAYKSVVEFIKQYNDEQNKA